MCLIVFSHHAHPKYRLALAANRDEFYERPAAPLGFWEDHPQILGGRDLTGGGSWMGVNKRLSFAAITNYRDPASINPDAPTRGNLVKDFLLDGQSPREYMARVEKIGPRHNGFNLIVGDRDEAWFYSNGAAARGKGAQKIPPGFYGLSNRILDTPWPKVKKAKAALKPMLTRDEVKTEAVFQALGDRSLPPAEDLPETGVGPEWEKMLSPVFISSPGYGTRGSSILLIEKNETARFLERRFIPQKDGSPRETTREFRVRGETNGPF
ncbi:conserved hypothetical protein [Candidatus Desulfarcum epimagneticum]|uniref:NRDE family protein n=1 Tax=uncultured Desulfobacteraceae bacterium TaxID=218296 RepID=A0A484HNM6_9BACT|nr:conserved hypothetical protein [uncultured Desulfobacteraceae bacterium]